MKKALPLAIAMLFVCPILNTSTVLANDGGNKGSSPSVLHRDNVGKSWIDKAWDDLMNLFKSHHDNGNDKDKGKGPGHRDGPGSGHNGNDGNHNGGDKDNGNHNGWSNGNGNGGNSGGGDGGSTGNTGGGSPSAPLDGGLSLLMIAGVGLGVKKTLGKKKEA